MNSAPEIAWRILFFAFVCGSVAWFVLSDPVYVRVSNPRAHPAVSTLLFAGCLAVVGAGGWWFLIAYVPAVPVTISPRGPLVLGSGKWKSSTGVTIANQTEKHLYSVFVKFWTETAGVTSKDIQIEPPEDNPNTPIATVAGPNGSSIQVRSDVLIVDAVDAIGHETVWVRFYELPPRARRTLLVSGMTQPAASVFMSVLHSKEEPDGVLEQPGKAALLFAAPENGQVKSFRVKTGKVDIKP